MGIEEFKSSTSEPADPAATVHVALLDGDGTVMLHEEVPEGGVPLCLARYQATAGLDVRDIPGAVRKVYHGKEWPPDGYEVKKGKVVPVVAEE